MPTFFNWQAAGQLNGRFNSYSPHLREFQTWVNQNYGGSSAGGHVERPVRGGESPSSHAFGAAWDWAYDDRAQALQLADMIIANPDAFGIQAIHDYAGMRVWRVGRGWRDQPAGSHGGMMNPGQHHLHFEVSLDDWAKTGYDFDAARNGTAGYGTTDQARAGGDLNTPTGPVQLPSDTKLVSNEFGIFAVYDLGGTWIYFSIPWGEKGAVAWEHLPVERITDSIFQQRYPNAVSGGDARELAAVTSTFGSFTSFWESILDRTISRSNPARNDPEVRRILAEFAGRPDMSDAELQNKLRSTAFWANKTQSELAWNDLSDAERNARRQDVTSQLAELGFEYLGVTGFVAEAADVEAIASGKITVATWLENTLKPLAAKTAESPYARDIRAEAEEKRAYGIDIENTVVKVRDLVERWGLRWNEDQIYTWGKNIRDKVASEDDLLTALQDQAAKLYPWKDPTQETLSAAAPWLETYKRTMEGPATLRTAEVQKALTQGTPIWQFEQELRSGEKWTETKNGQASMTDTAAQMAKLMGFAA